VSSYRLMDAEKACFEIARMAVLLGVSRSGYYAWMRREQAGPTPAQQRRTALTNKIITFHADSDQVYGSPRILADLRDDGETVSRKTVAKLMRSNRIVGISPRGWTPITTLPDPESSTIPDLVGRRFDHGQLNRVWTSDITYLATGEGWLYLCAVRDGCSRRVLGWSVQDHLRADLVDQALTMAVVLRGTLPAKVIFHADRGTQGGFNRSSQHLDRGGVDGQAGGLDDGVDGQGGDEVAGEAVASAGGRAGVLARGRQRSHQRAGSSNGGRVTGGRNPVVPRAWRHAADRSRTTVWPVSVVP
jgi:HTH-like domain/Integrase core domain